MRTTTQKNCHACGHQIVFLLTRKGSKMPVNAESTEPGDEQWDRSRHVSHFDTCPHADKFKKAK